MKPLTWEELKNQLEIGDLISGTVIRHEPYGIFIDIGHNYEGLIQLTDFKDEGIMTSSEYPAIGAQLEAKVLGYKEYGSQIWLSVKPSVLKPEVLNSMDIPN